MPHLEDQNHIKSCEASTTQKLREGIESFFSGGLSDQYHELDRQNCRLRRFAFEQPANTSKVLNPKIRSSADSTIRMSEEAAESSRASLIGEAFKRPDVKPPKGQLDDVNLSTKTTTAESSLPLKQLNFDTASIYSSPRFGDALGNQKHPPNKFAETHNSSISHSDHLGEDSGSKRSGK